MKIGVLALQGDFIAHCKMVEKLGHEAILVKNSQQMNSISGLILPGGESSTHIKLLEQSGLIPQITHFFQKEHPIFGTCAGLILISKSTTNYKQFCFNFLDVEVTRNAYGSQKESFTENVLLSNFGHPEMKCVFIRAPKISKVGTNVEVLGTYKESPILVRQGRLLGATFHPELTEDLRIHQLFTTLCAERGDVYVLE